MLLTEHGLHKIQERWNKSTPGPWKWSGDKGWPGPQLEGNIQYEEMNPILVTTGCTNENDTNSVQGCMPDKFDNPLQACPLHPSTGDREFIANAHSDIELLLDYVRDISKGKRDED